MDRLLVLAVPERFALSCSYRQRVEHLPSALTGHRLALKTDFLNRSFVPSAHDVLDHHAAGSLVKRSLSAGALSIVWMMVRGPRTFPGGAKKWQWKRRLKKADRDLAKSRLERERMLFKVRRHVEIKNSTPLVPPASFYAAAPNPSAHGTDASPARDFLPLEAAVDDRLALVGQRLEATEGMQAWTGSREEVAEQIKKVRNLLRKDTLFSGPSDSETTSSFRQLPLSPLSLKALHTVLCTFNMTPSQEDTLPFILKGEDLLAKTKGDKEDIITSLLCAIEVILKVKNRDLPKTEFGMLQKTVSGRQPVYVVFMCPTHERATFVADLAKLLLTFHSNIRVQLVLGGNDMRKELQRLKGSQCEILIVTPGRLLSYIKSVPEFRGQLRTLKLLVLDQVQKLLDMGYCKTIERISQMISKARQTLLWSTSQSDEVHALSLNISRIDKSVVDTCEVEEGVVPYSMVSQEFYMVPMEKHLASVLAILKGHVEQEPNYKVVVFCQTARTTTFLTELFKNLGFSTRELHMREREKHREKVSSEFRTCKGGLILFTCGASVWGVGNPDVTLVIQIGPPSGREQYIQRVTLSGQETKNRHCIILLMPHERPFLRQLTGLPISESTTPHVNAYIDAQIQLAMRKVNGQLRAKAYLAWLRFHIMNTTSAAVKLEVIQLADVYSSVLSFQTPPHLNSRTVKVLGLDQRDSKLILSTTRDFIRRKRFH